LSVGEIGHAEEHCELARQYATKALSARAEYLAAVTGLVDVHANRTDIG
jgi:hypothetical protein